ncbi:MAG: hypothetical protein GF331_00245 [Chitinivibrionales bacterium]|nr:hypothetical protein [Chitinivibrionales bacterium]
MMTSRDNLLNTLTSRRVLGKPYFVSEWDVPWPNEYRAEVPLLTAAAGAMQGWGGFAIHTYRYHNEPTDKIGRDVVLGGSFYRGIFDSFNDPAKFGLFYHAALLFRRADVRESTQTVGLDLREPQLAVPQDLFDHVLSDGLNRRDISRSVPLNGGYAKCPY